MPSGQDTELALVTLAAMFSPTTLSFSVLALVLGKRPLRTGLLFYSGALAVNLVVGLVGWLVLGNHAASSGSSPKTWVAVVDVVAGVLLLAYVIRVLRRPADPAKAAAMVDRMGSVTNASAIAILGAGAALANAGAFLPIALKDISQTDPTAWEFAARWLVFAFLALLPLTLALVMLAVAPSRAVPVLESVRSWLEHHARVVAAAIVVLLAFALIRNGIAGLT